MFKNSSSRSTAHSDSLRLRSSHAVPSHTQYTTPWPSSASHWHPLCCPCSPLQDDLYISQVQQGGGNILLHIMGDFASQVFASSLQNNPLPLEEVEHYVVRVGQEEAATPPQTTPAGDGEGQSRGGSADEQSGGVGVSSEAASGPPPVATEVRVCDAVQVVMLVHVVT